MNGKVVDIEPSQQRAVALEPQITRLQADTLLWAGRALKLAHGRGILLEDGKEASPFPHGNREFLAEFRYKIRPWTRGRALKALDDLGGELPQLEAQLENASLALCSSDRTIESVARNCSLRPVEEVLLRFRVALSNDRFLSALFDRCFSRSSASDFFDIVSPVLGFGVQELRDALNPDAFLSRSRLLVLRSGREGRFGREFEDYLFINPTFLQLFEVADGDFGRFVRTVAFAMPEEGLAARDFSYLEDEWALALGYLKGSLEGKVKGANILLHGLPGVGKTEFARAIVRAAGAAGYEIKSANLDHHVLSSEERRDRYFMAGELLPTSDSVIIFDDADGSLELNRPRHPGEIWSKAALNKMLENNPYPTIWILNETANVDGALMRRFDVAIPFRRPPASVLRGMLGRVLPQDSVSDTWIRRVASADGVTPAVVKRLERISTRLGQVGDLEKMLETSLQMSRIHVPAEAGEDFNRGYCNADVGIDVICGFLKRSQTSRLMLHGPTGTGKTALARYIADMTGLRPRLVRPSEILGPYVGQTEHNIAKLFTEADPAEQLIILDEFESLAEDRRGDHRSWEISKVAEFLNRLDEYKGRVVACTNLPDNVDPAIRRRFHLKAKLDAMTLQQRADVVREFTEGLDIEVPEIIRRDTDRLEGLAFGHVKNAAEVASHMEEVDWPKFIDLIRAELGETGGGPSRPFGFVS